MEKKQLQDGEETWQYRIEQDKKKIPFKPIITEEVFNN